MNRIRTLPIVFECNNYFILNKPYFMFSQPGDVAARFRNYPHHARPPVVLDELRHQHGLGNASALEWRTVHRLDANVTGGMLITKNKNAAIQFSKNLQKGGNKGYKMIRRYVAMVQGDSVKKYEKDEGVISSLGMTSKYKRFDERCFILELVTGGKHQVRRHLAEAVGQPILNDTRFGGIHVPGTDEEQIALHSACIKTSIGLQNRKHLIPMQMNNNGKLWNPLYIDNNGDFIPKIREILLEDWSF